MKIEEFKIILDSPVFYSGEKVTGRVIIRTNDQHLIKTANVCLKFYDKLEIEWLENEIISLDSRKSSFANRKKPFEIDEEKYFDHQNAVIIFNDNESRSNDDNDENSNDNHFTFAYPFEFQLPSRLQGTINVPNAKCNYYIKAYYTDDESSTLQFQKNLHVITEFFKSLTHKFCKQHILIHNRVQIPNELVNQKHHYEANSPNMHVIVTLPKIAFTKGENICFQVNIVSKDRLKEKFDLHKISIKINQMVKLTSDEPYEKVKLFDNLIAHKSRKGLSNSHGNCIIVDESIEIPKDAPCTSTRSVNMTRIKHSETTDNHNNDLNNIDNRDHVNFSFIKKFLNPIRINYKLNLEFWKNFLVDEVDIKIPLLIDPEE